MKIYFINKAKKDIYEFGKFVTYGAKRKIKIDKTIPRDEFDKVIIKRGESYYWWQHTRRERKYSKTEPSKSSVKRISYLDALYGFNETLFDD